MEEKLKAMEGKYGKEAVKKVKEKITTLREKSKEAREKALEPKPIMEPEHELPAPKKEAKPAGKELPPPPPPPEPEKKIEVPKFHETEGVEFTASGEGKLKPLPDLEVPRPPPIEKKGFFKKLFGKKKKK